jgi:soluble lytic murein transglycosylase-like protein
VRAPLIAAVLLLAAAGARADTPWPWAACFDAAARLHDVPLDLLVSVAATESAWDADARSDADAHGIMQIQWPGTARHLGVLRLAELYDPCLNIERGARYLRELLDRFDGDEARALAAYNYGPTRIAAAPELPAGARRYVETVARHRARLVAVRGPAPALVATSPVAFDRRARAERYAAALGRGIDSGRFEVVARDDGRHGVALRTGPDGLSVSDARRLRDLGWPGAGS